MKTITTIPGFPGYAVNRGGEIWSCRRNGRRRDCGKTWYKLKPGTVGAGQQQVVLYKEDGSKCQRKVHQLVLLTFIGPCPPGLEGCHYDGNPRNNALDNLRWDTKQSNAADRRRHQTYCGEKVWTSKLTTAQVREIRHRHANGESQCSLGRAYRVSQANIRSIIIRATWVHI